MATVEERFKSIVADKLGREVETIKTADSFMDDLNADSLDMVELIMAVEEEFAVSISDEDAENIKTVQNAMDFLAQNGVTDE